MRHAVIVLAAGKGTRMKSDTVKVLHPLAGRPVLAYSLDAGSLVHPDDLIVVVGHQGERVREAFDGYKPNLRWVMQPSQMGTGDAVRCAMPSVSDGVETVLVLYGDVPLLRKETLEALLGKHATEGAAITMLTACLENPTGYGRILRDSDGSVVGIREEMDASAEEKRIDEINTGIYCFQTTLLREALDKLEANNAQGEFYLTDIVAYAASRGETIRWIITDEPFRALGINSRKDLAESERILRSEINEAWMLRGVTIVDPAGTYIEPSVVLDRDTHIEPNCHLRGNTTVGRSCRLGTGSVVEDSRIGDNVIIRPWSVIEQSDIKAGTRVGPLAHLTRSV